jgi:hypothetical protein
LITSGKGGPGASRENQRFWAAAPPEHVKFYRDHKPEIDKLVEQMTPAVKDGQK